MICHAPVYKTQLDELGKALQVVLFLLLVSMAWPVQAGERGPYGTIRVGIFPFEPFNFMDINDVAQGLNPDLLREIVRNEDWELEFIAGSWAEGLERLQRQEIDLLVSVAYSPERAETMDFSYQSVAELWGQVFVRPDGRSYNINELSGRKVAVMRSDISGSNFIKTVEKLGVRCQILEFASHADVFAAVRKGDVDAGVAPQHFGLRHTHEYNLVGSTILFSPFSIFFASKKGHQHELLSHIDAHLSSWKKDKESFYYQSLNRWLGDLAPRGNIPVWLIYSLIAAGASALLFSGFVLLLKKTVKRRTEELRESEGRFKALHNASFGGIAIHDGGLILECNQGLSEISGYAVEELIGMDGLLLIAPDSRELVKNKILAGHEKPYEAVGIQKNGKEYPIRLEGRNITYKGKNVRVVEFRDISEYKKYEAEQQRLQEQLLQAQKMESVGRLAGGVAHDFNNMLGVILGHTELSLNKVNPAEPIYAALEEIRKAAERSANLTRQLLAFARKQTIAPAVLDFNAAISGMLKMVQRLIGEDIDLVWLPEPTLWTVKMDPSQLDQLLANLCVNARDAISGIGKITIETENNMFDAAYCAQHPGFIPGEYVLLAVSDNGCGMDKQTLAHLYEPFFTTKAQGKGTGLGLATVYGIVKQNKGFINVYSEPGQGTTFKIYLPRHGIPAESALQVGPTKPEVLGRGTILLVEDETAILEMTTAMLLHLGYTVLPAHSPGEAIRLAQAHKGDISLLLTDVVMPEMNGLDLATQLISLCPDLRTLFMSGYTANVIAHHGVLDNGVQFIEKPFSMKDLAAKIRVALEGEEGSMTGKRLVAMEMGYEHENEDHRPPVWK